MSYDRKLADRLRAVLSKDAGVVERTMFGGLAFLLRDNMCCGVVGEDLVLRVGPDDYAAALQEPHARKMDFTGKPLKGFVYVRKQGVDSDEDLRQRVGRAVRFIRALPRKRKGSSARTPRAEKPSVRRHRR